MNDSNSQENPVNPHDILKITPEVEEQLCGLIRENRIAEAEELYCLKRDCGLEEAHQGVLEIASKHKLEIVKQKKIGCATIILILVTGVTLVIWLALFLVEKYHF